MSNRAFHKTHASYFFPADGYTLSPYFLQRFFHSRDFYPLCLLSLDVTAQSPHSCFATTLDYFAFFCRLSPKARESFINIYSKLTSTERFPFISLALICPSVPLKAHGACSLQNANTKTKKEAFLNKPRPELSGFHISNIRYML